ncbi:MAG: hypothetical protein RSD49_06740 [Hafnia sp.]
MWETRIVIGQDHWQMDLVVGGYDTMEQAKKVGTQKFSPCLVVHDGQFALQVFVDGEKLYFFDKDIVVSEINPEKRKSMGKPLDVSDPGNVELINKRLESMDESYVITQDDMVPSTLLLEHLAIMYGLNRLDCLAYGVSEVAIS